MTLATTSLPLLIADAGIMHNAIQRAGLMELPFGIGAEYRKGQFQAMLFAAKHFEALSATVTDTFWEIPWMARPWFAVGSLSFGKASQGDDRDCAVLAAIYDFFHQCHEKFITEISKVKERIEVEVAIQTLDEDEQI